MEQENDYDVMIKIVLLGESGVGKTNIFQRYVNDEFSENTLATIGMDFVSLDKDIDGKRTKLQLWDTAGSEKYRTIAQSYYTITNGIMLVYDVTDKQSFERVN